MLDVHLLSIGFPIRTAHPAQIRSLAFFFDSMFDVGRSMFDVRLLSSFDVHSLYSPKNLGNHNAISGQATTMAMTSTSNSMYGTVAQTISS
jgi:hypothetical protein